MLPRRVKSFVLKAIGASMVLFALLIFIWTQLPGTRPTQVVAMLRDSGLGGDFTSSMVGIVLVLNVGTLGIRFYMSGRDLDRLSSARGAALILLGINLLVVPYFVFVASPQQYSVPSLSLYGPAAQILVIISFLGTIRLVRKGRRYEAPSAAYVLSIDARSPVVYLRPFSADDEMVIGARSARGIGRLMVSLAALILFKSPEEEIVDQLKRIGPVVALAKPGEAMTLLGAARMRVGGNWQSAVTDLLNRAALVVIRFGATPGLAWEVQEARRIVPAGRLLVLIMEQGPEIERAAAGLGVLIGENISLPARGRRCLGFVLSYSDDGKLRAEEIATPSTLIAEDPLPLFRLYREPLRRALSATLQNFDHALGRDGSERIQNQKVE